MKRMSAVMAVVLVGSAAPGQYARVWTQPAAPATDALDRLNLRLGWNDAIPVFGYRDGIATVQNLGDVIIVQTRSGAITAIDPMTGAARWRTAVGLAYPVTHNVGHNDNLILVANGTRIYGLDRATGHELWAAELSATPSSPPSANGNAFYVCLSNGRLSAYAFPVDAAPPPVPGTGTKPSAGTPPSGTAQPRSGGSGGYTGAASSARAPGVGSGRAVTTSVQATGGRTVTTAVQATGGRTATGGGDINRTARGNVPTAGGPRLLWDYQTNLRISERPIIGEKNLLVLGTGREALFINKDGGTPLTFTAESPFTAPPNSYFDVAYTGCANGTVYAFDLVRRATLWEMTVNGAVTQRPTAHDEDLFVSSERGGVARLTRANGQLVWQNPAAVAFIAANPKFVYARDAVGGLIILDRARGTTLTRWDVLRDYPKSVPNAESDRIILAADDGRLISLHDRAYPQPLHLREAAPPPPLAPPTSPPAEDKPPPTPPKPTPAEAKPAPKPTTPKPANPPTPKPPQNPPPTTPPATPPGRPVRQLSVAP